MKKIGTKQKIIVIISIILITVIVGIVVSLNVIKINISKGKYNTANNNSSSSNLLPEYIKEGITLGGVTGTLVDLDTSDATATAMDITYGKTAYVDGKKITGTYRTIGMLNTGDYIAYTPDIAENYVLTKEVSGYTTNQTISQDNLNWQIMNINNDGTVDLVSASQTSDIIRLGEATGYNNGVFILNDIASKQYSNEELGVIARSINITDIEKNMNSSGINKKNEYHNSESNVILGNVVTFTTGYNSQYPNLYAEEIGSGINTTITKTEGASPNDNFYSSPSLDNPAYSEASISGLTVTQTYYNIKITNDFFTNNIFFDLIFNNDESFWIASRYANCYSNDASFGIRRFSNNRLYGYDLFHSRSIDSENINHLRPVVTLNSNTRILGGDGKSPSTAYKLKE